MAEPQPAFETLRADESHESPKEVGDGTAPKLEPMMREAGGDGSAPPHEAWGDGRTLPYPSGEEYDAYPASGGGADFEWGYANSSFVPTPPLVAAMGGERHPSQWALPWFPTMPENRVRYTRHYCCGAISKAPNRSNIPERWLQGGLGWYTQFFATAAPFNQLQHTSGFHRCTIPTRHGEACGHQVNEEVACDNDVCGRALGCWALRGTAPLQMRNHIREFHGLQPPAGRSWSTGLCDTDGCCDAWCCFPCQGSRQMMALTGHHQTCSKSWCAYLSVGAPRCGCYNSAGAATICALPIVCFPCFIGPYIARFHVATVSGIEEPDCTSCCVAAACPCCSLAQTYRELRREAAPPGRYCGCNGCDDRHTGSYYGPNAVIIGTSGPSHPHGSGGGGGGGGGGGNGGPDPCPDCRHCCNHMCDPLRLHPCGHLFQSGCGPLPSCPKGTQCARSLCDGCEGCVRGCKAPSCCLRDANCNCDNCCRGMEKAGECFCHCLSCFCQVLGACRC